LITLHLNEPLLRFRSRAEALKNFVRKMCAG
jgi:hypothetical protein